MKKYKLKEHIVLEWTNEWEQLNRKVKWNWITITPIHVQFGSEYFGYDFRVVIFGLGFNLRYNTNKSLRLFKKWNKEIEKEFSNLYEK